MSSIKPFQALFYNIDKVKDMTKVVCPPYDVISAEEQIQFHNLSLYNFTRIALGRDKPRDNGEENKYSRAKQALEEWGHTPCPCVT